MSIEEKGQKCFFFKIVIIATLSAANLVKATNLLF